VPGPAGAATISGHGAPVSADGNLGDFYLDLSAYTEYGPKAPPGAYGPNESVFGSTVPPTPYTGPYELGDQLQFNVAGQIVALRFYRAATDTVTSRVVRIWNTAGTLLLTSPATSEPPSTATWVQVNLVTPFAVNAGEVLIISRSVTGDWLYGPSNSPISDITWVTGPANTTLGNCPSGTSANRHYNDVQFQSAPNQWPVAIPSLVGPPVSTAPLALANVSTEPAAPSSGGILYAFGGALKYVGSSGTRTTVAPA
jgi:hypothetical protein